MKNAVSERRRWGLKWLAARFADAISARVETRLFPKIEDYLETKLDQNLSLGIDLLTARHVDVSEQFGEKTKQYIEYEVQRSAAQINANISQTLARHITSVTKTESQKTTASLDRLIRQLLADQIGAMKAEFYIWFRDLVSAEVDAKFELVNHNLSQLLVRDSASQGAALSAVIVQSMEQARALMLETLLLGIGQAKDQITEVMASHVSEHVHGNAALINESLGKMLSAVSHDLAADTERVLQIAIVDNIQRSFAELDQSWGVTFEKILEPIPALQNMFESGLSHLHRSIIESVHQQLAHVDQHLSDHLTKQMQIQYSVSGIARPRNSTEMQQRLRDLGHSLSPMAADGFTKIRVGNDADGGYVMIDDFERVEFALSFGVGTDTSWENALANRNIAVYQFDHTVEAPPQQHPLVVFHKIRIGRTVSENVESLQSALQYGNSGLCIVKADIEGDEWGVFESAAPAEFDRITQLVCEFHDFDRVSDDKWFALAQKVLAKLNAHFFAVHVHANNNGLLTTKFNVAFPELLEVTFANRKFYSPVKSDEQFPTSLDRPNRPDLPDILLGSFQFT